MGWSPFAARASASQKNELRNGLAFLLCAVILLPLAPDRPLGPYNAINPQSLVRLVLVLTAISAAGQLAERLFGPRFGLSLTGLAGGLVSSTATIVAMGQRAREHETSWPRAASGALASNIATVALYPVMMAAVDPGLLPSLAAPLLWAGTMAVLSASALFWLGMRHGDDDVASTAPAFRIWTALGIVGLVTVVSISSAALQAHLGGASIVVISAVAALVDAHAAAGSVANLHHSGAVDGTTARLSVVMALTANSLTKLVMAWSSRHRLYALCVSAGIVAMVCGAWLGLALS
jgi:uncharacterized membrane protein (DUF4010 family)